MTRRNRRVQIFIVVFHIGVVLTLFASIGINTMVTPKTEPISDAVDSFDALATTGVSEEILFDSIVMHGFEREDRAADNAPVPTLALLFPLVLLLWVKRCRWLIEKRQFFFAFPVF